MSAVAVRGPTPIRPDPSAPLSTRDMDISATADPNHHSHHGLANCKDPHQG
jgi:hypothetical protein